jgi:hypothetical protein
MMRRARLTSFYFQFERASCAWILAALFSTQSIASEPTIDRLFFSQKERASLDQGRQTGNLNRIDPNAANDNHIGDLITIDGFVRKNNGKTTVWINQVPQHDQDHPQGISILRSGRNSAAISMQLPSGKSVQLKAGQSFDATNGKVTDVYGDAPKRAGTGQAK